MQIKQAGPGSAGNLEAKAEKGKCHLKGCPKQKHRFLILNSPQDCVGKLGWNSGGEGTIRKLWRTSSER
jgi:hypothetical protein